MLAEIWREGFAQGLPHKANLFDESVERIWTDMWLFHANSIRFTSAMGGGGDYGVFADGRYQLTSKLKFMEEWLKNKQTTRGQN